MASTTRRMGIVAGLAGVLIIVIAHDEGTPQADLDAAQAIVDSFEFTP